ncbi:MAG: hypothetical protein NVS2B9_14410 [Myxococcales bacterium]
MRATTRRRITVLSIVLGLMGCGKNNPPPPQALVVLVSPSTVWTGTSTNVTVFAANVTTSIAKVRIVPVGGKGPSIDLAATVPAGHTDRPSAVVPAGTAPGAYDVVLVDTAGATGAALAGGLTVVQTSTIDLARISPRFGGATGTTAVTLESTSVAFPELPGVFLSRAGTL